MNKIEINEKVSVTSLGFRKNLEIYPRRIEFRGNTYYFLDAGLRCFVRQGEKIAEVFTMSDGISRYHLRSENNGVNWTLLSIAF